MQASSSQRGEGASFFSFLGVTALKLVRRFLADQSGATAIEYALIAAVIGLGILAGAQTLHNAIEAKYVGAAANVNAIN